MKSRPLVIFASVWMAALGIVASGVGVLSATRGDFLAAAVAAGGAVFCFGIVVPMFKVVPGRVEPRIEGDRAGTNFRPDPGIDIPVQASLGGAVLASTLIVILLPIGKLGIPVPPHMRYSLPFMTAIIAICGTPVLWRNLRRGSSKYLRLTPDGFEVVQGWQPRSGDWNLVKDVTSEEPGKKSTAPGSVVFVMVDDVTFSIAASSITPDGSALRDLVRFYWQNAESRDELTNERAAERLRKSLR